MHTDNIEDVYLNDLTAIKSICDELTVHLIIDVCNHKKLKEHHTNIEDSRLWNVYAKRLLHGRIMP